MPFNLGQYKKAPATPVSFPQAMQVWTDASCEVDATCSPAECHYRKAIPLPVSSGTDMCNLKHIIKQARQPGMTAGCPRNLTLDPQAHAAGPLGAQRAGMESLGGHANPGRCCAARPITLQTVPTRVAPMSPACKIHRLPGQPLWLAGLPAGFGGMRACLYEMSVCKNERSGHSLLSIMAWAAHVKS